MGSTILSSKTLSTMIVQGGDFLKVKTVPFFVFNQKGMPVTSFSFEREILFEILFDNTNLNRPFAITLRTQEYSLSVTYLLMVTEHLLNVLFTTETRERLAYVTVEKQFWINLVIPSTYNCLALI